MRNIVPDLLWISSALDVADLTPILDAGIEAVVDLALNEKPAQLTRDSIYCRFPLNDGGGSPSQHLRAAVDGVESLISTHTPTFVYCSAGMSRSFAITAVALARFRGQKPKNTLVALASGQPHDVSPILWGDICKACDHETTSRRETVPFAFFDETTGSDDLFVEPVGIAAYHHQPGVSDHRWRVDNVVGDNPCCHSLELRPAFLSPDFRTQQPQAHLRQSVVEVY